VTTIGKLLGASTAAAVMLLGVAVHAQTTDTTKKKAPAKPASVCKGLDEAACKAKTECGWIAPKTGKQKPYCRLKTTPKKAAAPAAPKDPAPAPKK
jgi:hypothetical protein